ncbi:Gibberellin 2-beta-dioxygenase 2 [Acorus calamus]|uniref:Gibberellin 2-beta-dioxygenase 2 n=1 Tax=Acorus calamus TaxID=4465 RepID=A0AAV9CT74_ACOCL|nr:Gibberellin 2-beta-dioxygenase 2 [Acorus calamus]
MVAAPLTPVRPDCIRPIGLPVIDLTRKRSDVVDLIVRASEELGFFKVINHGVPPHVVANMEAEAFTFFAQPPSEKLKAGPPNPLGYGCKNIGFNGDTGEVEYLLLHTNQASINHRSKTISKDPNKFSCTVREYVEAVKDLAVEILELVGEGLRLSDPKKLARLIRDGESDSVFRLNHYPSLISTTTTTTNNNDTVDKDNNNNNNNNNNSSSSSGRDMSSQQGWCNVVNGGGVSVKGVIGFGEHSDPQILTLLRSNDVVGLQISLGDGLWAPVSPDPDSFSVNVGDALQALTNGRFISVRHRAMVNPYRSRLSMVYFGAPPLHARIAPLPETVTAQTPSLYRPFTWAEYKKAAYSLRLSHSRLDPFRTVEVFVDDDDDDQNGFHGLNHL